MSNSDIFGNWESIGEVTLTTSWQLFPNEIIAGENFRFTYALDWDKWLVELDSRVKMIGRFYYPTGNDITLSPSFVLFPKREQDIKTYLLPTQIKDAGVIIRSLGVKAVRLNRHFYYSNASIINIKLNTEYLL
jgi:hypothetical protein